MFGYVTASWKELTAEEQKRYGAVYCGICREIRQRSTGIGRICLSYDMAFLALLLMLLGIASVFVCISLITTAVLQATFMFM